VDTLAARIVLERGQPGLAFAITDREAVLHEVYVGFADRKTGRPVTENTLFQIGSITKSFTALCLMALADRGIFDPHVPVSDYLPWFSVPSEYGPITGHHLLTHSAGIPSNRDDITASPYQAFAIRQQRAAWAPGERFLYSNVGYQILHVLLEHLDERPFDRILTEEILVPAGMDHARPVITLASRSEQAVGYIPPFDDRPHHFSRGLIEAPHFPYDVGDGSVQASARDLAAYARLLLNRGVGPGGRVVSEDAFERFSTGYVQDGLARYGYGMWVDESAGRTVLRHSGGMVGFSAFLMADTVAGLGSVSLGNGPFSGSIVARYALAVGRAIQEGTEIPEIPESSVLPDLGSLANYVGTYASPTGDAIHFSLADSALAVVAEPRPVILERRGEDRFYTTHPRFDRYMFVFERDPSGTVVAVSHGPSWFASEKYEGPVELEVPDSWNRVAGRYRSWSPWLPYFEIFERAGSLILLTGEGGESSSGEVPLFEEAPGVFRIGGDPTPERLSFHDFVDGRALTADWSGHVFFRTRR
jgi:CubicO group peptidase (beta-lactamase class C family)